MKLEGEIQYDDEKAGLFEGLFGDTHYENISFSLQNVTDEDVAKLCQTIESGVYAFKRIGHNFIRQKGDSNSSTDVHLFSSPTKKNKVQLAHYRTTGLVNIFIQGPKAEGIETNIIKLLPAENLENLALEGKQ